MKKEIPLHVAIIPDGNRRWALSRGLLKVEGYSQVDYKYMEKLLLEAKKLGVKYVSLWIFSTENWRRPKPEVSFLFNHFLKNAEALLKGSLKHEVRVRHIGRKDRLPRKLVDVLEKLEEGTRNFKDFNVQLCLDYGGRDEIVRAVNKIINEKIRAVDEDIIKEHLDDADIPDVDLIIRTSGEKRTSGLMPFQSIYAELYFTDKLFPDFKAADLRKAIEDFARRKRNFGK